MAPSILLIGGSGYLGQFLTNDFRRRGWQVVYTRHSAQPLPPYDLDAQCFHAELASGEGLARCFQAVDGQIDAVINCAAVSQPAACERDQAYARSINVPSTLLDALDAHAAQHGAEPLLVQLSTDQVYDGSSASGAFTELDPCAPVNAYGRSKVEGEQAVARRWRRHVILRSSLIYGSDPPLAPVGRSLFLQFVDDVLAAGTPTSFFTDEWRCPVFVGDVVSVCAALVERHAGGAGGTDMYGVYNMGGSQRLSRMEMAQALATLRGYDPALLLAAPAAALDRGFYSPADTSMDSQKLCKLLGLQMRTFDEGLALALALSS